MRKQRNRKIVMASRPVGAPKLSDFRLVEEDAPEPRDGEVLLRTLWLSLDPYMRGRMSAGRSYAKPLEVGDTIVGGTVNQVVASKRPDYAVGDVVLGYAGWQYLAISDGAGLRKLDPGRAPISTALGVLGMPGMTAYTGLTIIGQPKAGETVVVAAATGPVGSAVGQIAKIKGCRAVGIAGGAQKCRMLVDEFGFDVIERHIGVLEFGLEAAEFFFVLVGKEEALVGSESVLDSVLGGVSLSCFGAGAGGVACVFDVRGDLSG